VQANKFQHQQGATPTNHCITK